MIFRNIKEFINSIRPIKKEDRIKLSKETRKKMREHNREFRKAKREGRVMYDSDYCIVWLLDKKDKVWKKSTDFFNQ